MYESAVILRHLLWSAPLVLCCSGYAEASPGKLELDATIGYHFGGALDVAQEDEEGDQVGGRVTLDSALGFGGIVGYRVHEYGLVYLSYARQNTTLRYRSDQLDVSESRPLNLDYFQFGGNLEAGQGVLVPYFGVSVGATRFSVPEYGEEWRFSFVFDGGVKINLTDWLHLRLLGRVPLNILQGNSKMLCVSYEGCVVALDTKLLVQGELYAGAGFTF